jgi:peptide/nickel transport system substrate-binding protein
MGTEKRRRPALWPVVVMALVGAFVGAVRADAEPAANVFVYELDFDIDYVDPALAYFTLSWEIEYATCAKLLNYPDAPSPQGARLVPEVAAGMPTISADGLTYTFTIRNDFRFSTGETVTAQHFKFVLERLLRPQMASPAQPFFDDIVGAREMIDGTAQSLAGAVVDGGTLRITLTAPAGDFLARLALPFTCALPLATPINPDGIPAPVPSAGPYYVETWEPRTRIVLKENPNYTGPRPHRFDEIRYAIGQPVQTIREHIEAGDTDHGPVPPAAHAELATLYGPGSDAALAGKQQWFAYPSPAVRYLALNHDRPLFGGSGGAGNVDLKKAVNYIIDRQAMVDLRGAHAGTPTDQLLPPGVPGHTDAMLYPSRPDEERAAELDGWEPGQPLRPAVMYTCNTGPCIPTAEHVKAQLAKIGIDVTIQAFPRAVQFVRGGTRGEPFDITLEGWHLDYLDPYDFMFLLDGSTLRPANNVNFSYFDHQPYIDRLRAANLLSGEARFAALGQLDVDTMRDWAPIAPFVNDHTRLFYSERIGCHYYHPAYEVDLAGLCLRPELPVTDAQVAESAGAATFTVTLSNAEAAQLTVDYSTVDGTATAGQDYSATSGTLVFAPGDRTRTITVPILEDGTDEANETFSVRLANASKGTPTGGGGATILDNDAPPPPPPPPPPPLPPPPPPPPPAPPPSPPPAAAPPPPPRRTLASAGLVGGTVAVTSSGAAPIPVRCGGAACRGTVALFAPAGTRGLTARKPVKLGQARFSIPRGRTKVVRVRLSGRALKALKRAGRLKARAVLTLRQSTGRTTTRRSTIVLRAPRR